MELIHLAPVISFLTRSCFTRSYTRTFCWVATNNIGLMGWNRTHCTKPLDLLNGTWNIEQLIPDDYGESLVPVISTLTADESWLICCLPPASPWRSSLPWRARSPASLTWSGWSSREYLKRWVSNTEICSELSVIVPGGPSSPLLHLTAVLTLMGAWWPVLSGSVPSNSSVLTPQSNWDVRKIFQSHLALTSLSPTPVLIR